MGILSWIVMGLIVGGLAKAIMPGACSWLCCTATTSSHTGITGSATPR